MENSHDRRKLFPASKFLLNKSQDDALPPNLDAATFATEIGKYFVTKIDRIQRKLDVQNVDVAKSVEPFMDSVSVPPLV